jgi:hypothetical protein
VDTLRIALQNGAPPYGRQYSQSLLFPSAFGKVLNQLHVLARAGKDSSELIIGRLKQAERRVDRAIYNLNVLQALLPE